jgi:hypothetical protein
MARSAHRPYILWPIFGHTRAQVKDRTYHARYYSRTCRWEKGRRMAELYCPCPERHKLWGELWWLRGAHRWVFFDDLKNSETYAEQVEYCPACGRHLERKDLRMAVNPARWSKPGPSRQSL